MTSLENICINLIAEKFEQLHFGFTVSKDENLQRNFEFLQRRFSARLLTALFNHDFTRQLLEKRQPTDEYLDFLINKHLTYLSGHWLENSNQPMENIFRRLPNLTRVDFKDCGSDELLENVATFCPKITEIDATNSKVTDNGVKKLYEINNGKIPCPELKNIYIRSSLVTERGAKCLIQNLRSLEKIDYSHVPLLLHSIHSEKLRKSGKRQTYSLVELEFPSLGYLFLRNMISSYKGVLKTCLSVCPNLETLSTNILEKEELNLLTKFHFKELNIEFCVQGPEINMNSFLKTNGRNLISFTFIHCNMSISAVAAYCPKLEEFSVTCVKLADDDDDCSLKRNFASITKCSFTDILPPSNKAICCLLSSSPKLESVSFSSCFCLEMETDILLWCKNPSAKKIEFSLVDLEMEFLRSILSSCTTLKEMKMTNCFFPNPECQLEEIEKNLQTFAEHLPNQPKIVNCFVFEE